MPRLIDADELEKDYRNQFESVYKHIRDSVNPSDFFVERHAAYNKELVRMEMEAFCKYLQSRPTIDAEPVRHGRWGETQVIGYDGIHPVYGKPCSKCGYETELYKPNYCPNCGAKMDGGKDNDCE